MKGKSIVKPEPGMMVNLPLSKDKKTAVKRYIKDNHLVAKSWIAELVIKAITDPHPEHDEGHSATRYDQRGGKK